MDYFLAMKFLLLNEKATTMIIMMMMVVVAGGGDNGGCVLVQVLFPHQSKRILRT